MNDEPALAGTQDQLQDKPKVNLRRVAAWSLAVVVVVAVTIGVVASNERNARVQAEQDAAEPTAWENRLAMDQVLVETAKAAGNNSDLLPEQEETLTCIRNDGRPGVSYLLHPIKDGPLEDITANPGPCRAVLERPGLHRHNATKDAGGGRGHDRRRDSFPDRRTARNRVLGRDGLRPRRRRTRHLSPSSPLGRMTFQFDGAVGYLELVMPLTENPQQ